MRSNDCGGRGRSCRMGSQLRSFDERSGTRFSIAGVASPNGRSEMKRYSTLTMALLAVVLLADCRPARAQEGRKITYIPVSEADAAKIVAVVKQRYRDKGNVEVAATPSLRFLVV